MRHNSESLLVLSGAGRISGRAQPADAAEVIRSSISEIEEYTRIRLNSVPRATIHGRAVGDLVHLMVELLDNATAYSPADTPVLISSRLTSGGDLRNQRHGISAYVIIPSSLLCP